MIAFIEFIAFVAFIAFIAFLAFIEFIAFVAFFALFKRMLLGDKIKFFATSTLFYPLIVFHVYINDVYVEENKCSIDKINIYCKLYNRWEGLYYEF
jgi:hypothetical protein